MLYPKGAERISDLPWFLQVAIEHGMSVLNWYENLPKNEVPPRYLWADVDGLELWWKKIEERRSDGLPSMADSDDDKGTDSGTDNDLTRALRGD